MVFRRLFYRLKNSFASKFIVLFTGCGLLVLLFNIDNVSRTQTQNQSVSTLSSNIDIDLIRDNDGPLTDAIPEHNEPLGTYSGAKVGIILYLPNRDNSYFLIQFVTFIYASWHYIRHFAHTVSAPRSRLDLIVFCHPEACPYLPKDCEHLPTYVATEEITNPKCFFHPQESIGHHDGAVDSFAFIQDTHFKTDIVQRYDWIMRSDMDVFLSPFFLKWIPSTDIVTGQGGYCTEFNRPRLREIAAKYGMIHRGVHCTGSTWFGKANLIETLASLTATLAMVISNNEFNVSRVTGIEKYMAKSPEGEWPDWWRPVSTMYASEIALNHILPNISEIDTILSNYMDFPSCSSDSIYLHPHIHCWHSPCEFQKFLFLDPVVAGVSSNGMLPIFLKYTKYVSPVAMTVADYCTTVARTSLHQYAGWFKKLINRQRTQRLNITHNLENILNQERRMEAQVLLQKLEPLLKSVQVKVTADPILPKPNLAELRKRNPHLGRYFKPLGATLPPNLDNEFQRQAQSAYLKKQLNQFQFGARPDPPPPNLNNPFVDVNGKKIQLPNGLHAPGFMPPSE